MGLAAGPLDGIHIVDHVDERAAGVLDAHDIGLLSEAADHIIRDRRREQGDVVQDDGQSSQFFRAYDLQEVGSQGIRRKVIKIGRHQDDPITAAFTGMLAESHGFLGSAAGDARQDSHPAAGLIFDDIHQATARGEIHGNGFPAGTHGKDTVQPAFYLHFHQLAVDLLVQTPVCRKGRQHG